KALGVLVVRDRPLTVDDEQRAGLQEISRRLGLELVAARDSRDPVRDLHRRANGAPRRIERDRRSWLTADSQLAERRVLRPHEEAADYGVPDSLFPAPSRQRDGPIERDDAGRERAELKARDVQGREGSVGERHPMSLEPAVATLERVDSAEAS